MTRRLPVLLTLLLAAFVGGLDTTLVNVALPDLSRQLGASTERLQWVVDAFNLVFAAFLLSAGSLSDRLGRRRMLIVGLAVFGTASLIGAGATTSGELIAVRAVMGLGAALAFPATLSLILDAFPERGERARAIGLWGAVAGVAIAMGPIVGGWLLSRFAWPSIFIAMAPVAYLAIGCARAFLPDNEGDTDGPLDIGGLVTSALAMAALVFTIIEAPAHGWVSARTLIGFAAAVVLLGTFIHHERRAATPMIDLRIFGNPRFTAASVATKQIVTAGLLLSATFYAWDTTTTVHLSYAIISVQMVLGGLGMGLTSAPATESMMGAVSAKSSGVGSAVNDTTRLIGGTLGVAVIGSVFTSMDQQRIVDRLDRTALRHASFDTATQSVQGGLVLAKQLTASGSPLGPTVHTVVTNAFLHGLHAGCVVAAGVAVLGAAITAITLPSQPSSISLPPQPMTIAPDRRPEPAGETRV